MPQDTSLDKAVAAEAPGHAPIKYKYEQRIQPDVQNRPRHHANHRVDGAALGPQALVEHKAGGHKGRGQEHVTAVVLGIGQDNLVGPQQKEDGPLEDGAKHQNQNPQDQGHKVRGRKHLPGVLVLSGSQQPGGIAGRAGGQKGSGHHDNVVNGSIYTHRPGGVGSQLADKEGVGQVVGTGDHHPRRWTAGPSGGSAGGWGCLA